MHRCRDFIFSLVRTCGVLAVIWICAVSGTVAANDPGNDHALLIGIEHYDRANDLRGVAHDVRELASTLRERGGYTAATVVDSACTDKDATFGRSSERKALQEAIAKWLGERESTDRIILYFSGHGFRDSEKRLYLASQDCDPSDPGPGGIPISWLRQQLLECSAGSKLLILDSCHSGSARSARGKHVATAGELGKFFEDTEGLVTLAGCRGTQSSYLWPAKDHSIFTYWLIQGLQGNADQDPRGTITVNELDDYVTRQTRHTAQRIYAMDQQPTRLQGPNVTQSDVIRLKPSDLMTVLDDVAEQLDVLMRLNELDRVGVVPEFSSDRLGRVLGREYGILATQCPVDLSERVSRKARGDYRVANTRAVRELLQSHGVRPKDLGTSKSRGIELEGHSLSALVVGRIESLRGNQFSVQCQLLDLSTGDILGTASGVARLNASEIAMQGTSGQTIPVAVDDTPPAENDSAPVSDGREQARIESSSTHPLQDPDFPYRARVMVKGTDGKHHEREGSFRGEDYYVTLQRGEVFSVRYQTLTDGQQAFVKVLVDGLNTLPERTRHKGMYVEPDLGDRWASAQPVSLAEARAWGPIEPDREYSVRGFYLKIGADAEYDEFKVVDAAQSAATESGYTDQLGLITIAFYEPQLKPPPPPPGVRRVGTGRGDRYRTTTDVYRGKHQPGRLLAVIHLRYGE